MKKSKIIAPALGVLVLSTAASITGTVAWFTANSTVSVTGMTINTKVNSNLLIAATNVTENEPQYSNELDQTVSGLLEPVSTINAYSFFYTTDAKANGQKDHATTGDGAVPYTALNAAAAPTADELTAFNGKYSTSGAVGFVDYSFYLKATNAEATAKELRMTKCNLLYDGAALDSGDKAWRVAMFTDTSDAMTATTSEIAANKLVTILAPAATASAGALYFTSGKAVKTTTALDSVTNLGAAAVVASVAARQTEYHKVTVRLWLEGEDKTCNNETYALLNEDYTLDLAFELGTNTSAVTQIGSEAPAQQQNP